MLPAVALGIYDDGDEARPDLPYCARCARELIASGEFTVTQVLNPLALGTIACPGCGGSGRLWHDTRTPVPLDATRLLVEAEVAELVAAFDDVPPEGLTDLFYAHAYWELRFAVDALLADRRNSASGEQTETETS